MAQDNDRARAAERSDDVIAAVLADHATIKTMMNEVSVAGPDKEDRFRRLVAKLAVHETAEEEVVHPMGRRLSGGDDVVEPRLEEESKGKAALAELERMGVDAPEFDAKFDEVRDEILRHAEQEEQEELPRLDREVDADRLAQAAKVFRAAEKIGPTHAHEHSPESAAGNVLVGSFVAVADRARDAMRRAMSPANPTGS